MFHHLDYDNEIDLSSIQYSTPKKSSGGSYISQCYFTNEEGSNVPIILETPDFEFSQLKNNNNKIYIPIDYSEKSENFFVFIKRLRDYNIQYSSLRSNDWFKKPLPVSHMEDYHCDMIENIDGKQTINLLLVSKNDNIDIDIRDFNNDILDINQLTNRKVKCIVKIDTLKFLRKELVCILSVIKIQAQKENIIELIKEDTEGHLEIKKVNQSEINFTRDHVENIDTDSNDNDYYTNNLNEDIDNEEKYKNNDQIENNENEPESNYNETENYNEKTGNSDEEIPTNDDEAEKEEEDEKKNELFDDFEADGLQPINVDSIKSIESIDIDHYNNFVYEDDEFNNDEELNNHEELEKRIVDYHNSIKEAEDEYNKNLNSLQESEKVLEMKRNEFEELKKEKVNNEKQCYL